MVKGSKVYVLKEQESAIRIGAISAALTSNRWLISMS